MGYIYIVRSTRNIDPQSNRHRKALHYVSIRNGPGYVVDTFELHKVLTVYVARNRAWKRHDQNQWHAIKG